MPGFELGNLYCAHIVRSCMANVDVSDLIRPEISQPPFIKPLVCSQIPGHLRVVRTLLYVPHCTGRRIYVQWMPLNAFPKTRNKVKEWQDSQVYTHAPSLHIAGE